MSICFFGTSIGRISLKNALRSLYGQINRDDDRVVVYFDGKCEVGIDSFREEQDLFGNSLSLIVLDTNLGWWGHGIRNTYQKTLPCDYIHNFDDDDYYPPNVIPKIKNDITNNPGKLLLYKFRADGGTVWQRREISFGQIGTPSGVIPNRADILGEWGYFYGGDFQFYRQTVEKIGLENVVWKDTVIYATKPFERGFL